MENSYYSTAQKNNILKWRFNNRDKYNNYMNDYCKGYYQINAEKFREKRRNHYYYKKEAELFRKILI
jgi:hypothetical protein